MTSPMRYTKIPYDNARDFLRIRDFLVETHHRQGQARHWLIDRWEFCRAFAQTMMGTSATWPSTVGLWVDPQGLPAAVCTSEGEDRGEAHFFLDLPPGPLPAALVQELFDHTETHLRVVRPGEASLRLRVWEGYPELEAEAARRGLKKTWTEVMSRRPIDPAEVPVWAEGYRLAWGTQVDDGAKARAHIRAFGYEADPRALTTQACWAALRTMPDWRSELELFALAPDGSVAAFVNLWLDTRNALAVLEPVGTVPEHRCKGLARALVAEGGRRAWLGGARQLLVGSDQAFYRSCGFVPTDRHGVWEG